MGEKEVDFLICREYIYGNTKQEIRPLFHFIRAPRHCATHRFE